MLLRGRQAGPSVRDRDEPNPRRRERRAVRGAAPPLRHRPAGRADPRDRAGKSAGPVQFGAGYRGGRLQRGRGMRATGLTGRFERERPRLKALAYRMLGTLTDAEDAVQEAWIRLNRADTDDVDSEGARHAPVGALVSLSMPRARHPRHDGVLEA